MTTEPRVSGARETHGEVFRLEDCSARAGTKIWLLHFDLPGEKVNKFNERVMREFEALLPKLKSMANQIDALVVVSPKPGIFIAGADIKLIQSAKTSDEAEALAKVGQKLLNQWEDLPFPRVVAINGAALGGGCEFSLASSAIVMSNDASAKIGLPEIMLGVIPGMGGCVRLPQKVGLATALDLILSSKQLNGERAVKAGLAEACLPKENFTQSALKWTALNLKALKAGGRLAKPPALGGMGGFFGSVMESAPMRGVIFSKARQGVMSKTKGQYPAPLEAIQVMKGVGTHYIASRRDWLKGERRQNAMDREARGFGKMAATDVSKSLIRIFFLTETIKKANGLADGRKVDAPAVKMAGVLGAGVMGGGIAQLFADKGITTRMKDINVKGLELGEHAISGLFKKKLKRRQIKERDYLQKMNLVAPVLDYAGFGSVDLVVEAVIEKMDIKKKVFQELEGHVSEDCVIASNTSSLSVSEMQTALKKPERFVGMHFFNPVAKMPLVEVIRGAKSSDEAVVAVFELSKKLGKTPIVVKDGAGFLVNRLLVPYMNEAAYLLVDGAPIPEIDRALLGFGMPMGPMELVDEVGVDVGEKVLKILNEAFGERMKPAPGIGKVAEAGRLGKKNGKGLYVYEGKDGREKRVDDAIYSIIGIQPRSGALTESEMVERCILPMINEAARCLEDGIVATPEDVDLGMIFGTGFPPFRGGLLRYADTIGVSHVVERLRHYEKRFGERFKPSEALIKRRKFYLDA